MALTEEQVKKLMDDKLASYKVGFDIQLAEATSQKVRELDESMRIFKEQFENKQEILLIDIKKKHEGEMEAIKEQITQEMKERNQREIEEMKENFKQDVKEEDKFKGEDVKKTRKRIISDNKSFCLKAHDAHA